MNVRLQYDVDFLAGIYFEDRLQLNSYTVVLSLVTNTTNTAHINVAMDRLKAFIYGELKDTVFMNQIDRERAEVLSLIGMNVTTLPEDPVDQIIGMMLYYRLNAIMEGKMLVTGIDIKSELGDSVWFMHDEEDASGPFSAEGWWHESGPDHDNLITENDKVVKVSPSPWNEYNLNWPDTTTAQTGNTVVYGNFSRDENR